VFDAHTGEKGFSKFQNKYFISIKSISYIAFVVEAKLWARFRKKNRGRSGLSRFFPGQYLPDLYQFSSEVYSTE